jgi:Flp pilus assembly protein TadD
MRQRRYVSRALFIAGFFAAVLGLAGSAAAQTGRVGGVVKDEGGQPIKGATITAQNSNIGQSFTATTDDKGRFTMIGLRTGQWRFIAQAPGFAPEAGEIPVRMGAPNPPMTFGLKKTGAAQFGPLGGITAKDLQADLTAADALFNQRRWDDAITAYRAIMAKAPPLSVINLQIAAAYRNKKDYDAAIAAYDDLLKLDPRNEKAAIGISTTNLERGNAQAAEDALLKAAGSATAGREVYYSLGDVKFTTGETDEAIKWYRKAAAADPAWGKPLYKLGLCALKQGDKQGATKLMDQAIAVDPVSPEAALAKATLDSLNK